MDYIEYALGWSLSSFRDRDDELFTKGPAFDDFPKHEIGANSPDCGISGSRLTIGHTQKGAVLIPKLSWYSPLSGVKEYLIVCEDPDAPFPTPSLPWDLIFHAVIQNNACA
jgi:hypothetical protein